MLVWDLQYQFRWPRQFQNCTAIRWACPGWPLGHRHPAHQGGLHLQNRDWPYLDIVRTDMHCRDGFLQLQRPQPNLCLLWCHAELCHRIYVIVMLNAWPQDYMWMSFVRGSCLYWVGIYRTCLFLFSFVSAPSDEFAHAESSTTCSPPKHHGYGHADNNPGEPCKRRRLDGHNVWGA